MKQIKSGKGANVDAESPIHRAVTDHWVEGTENVEVAAVDSAGPGGAHHEYLLRYGDDGEQRIVFQKGGVAERGMNGVTVEALLAICKHRLECFQAGPFPCAENDHARTQIGSALEHLKHRTRQRVERSVEGKARE